MSRNGTTGGVEGRLETRNAPPPCRSSPATSHRVARHPRAHTLTELLVVMTILVLFAGIIIPRFASTSRRQRLDGALEALRSDLTFAKARAVSTGLRHQFMLDTSTGEVVVEAFRPEEAAGTTGSAQTESEPAHRNQLPEDVRVVRFSVSPVGAQTGTSAGGNVASENSPLVFYPEGTSDRAVVVLEERGGTQRGLLVDGMTGEIRELDAEAGELN